MAASVQPTARIGAFLDAVGRSRLLIVAVVVVAGLSALVVSVLQTPMYRSTTEVLMRSAPSLTAPGGGVVSPESLASEQALAQASSVVAEVEEQVGSETKLSVAVRPAASVLVFTAVSDDPDRAAEGAQVYAEVFIAQRRESRLDQFSQTSSALSTRINAITTDLAALRSQPVAPGSEAAEQITALEDQRRSYVDLRDSLALSGELTESAGPEIIQPAFVPSSPFEPTTARNVATAVLVGLALGLALALVAGRLDTSLRTEQQLRDAAGLPTLAVVPNLATWRDTHEPYLVARDKPRSAGAEAYRSLRTSLQFMAVDRPLGVLEVTSARPSEGKSTTAANLALVCARAGQRVIVVDCDLRQPRLHSFFGLEPSRGFTSVLIGEATAEQVVFQISDEPGLSVVPAGSVPPDPSALLSGQRVRQLISEFRSMADLVIVDTPPVMAVPDAEVLSGLVDGVILVASAGTTRRSTFRRACDQLRVAGAPMAGTVLNRIDLSAPGGRSGHRYGTHDADDARAVRGNGATTTS